MNFDFENKTQHMMPTYGRKSVCFEKGSGLTLWDTTGQAYLDLVSGVAVNALGHGSHVIQEALRLQSQALIHVSNLYWNKPQLELAETLIELSHGDMAHVFFCNSGTEALEAAIKICKKHGKLTQKPYLLYMNHSFHGRSTGALAITGQSKYQAPFGELIPHCINVPFNDTEALKAVLQTYKDLISGIFIEPVQGEGGVIPAKPSYIEEIKRYCQEHDALLVFDEVQCGAGRLGTYYAYQQFEVVPDIICMAKGLGGGIPIGAVLTNSKASLLEKGDHGSTYGGNPLMCAVSHSVTKTIGNPIFLNEVNVQAKILKDALWAFKEKGYIVDVRGQGLLLAMILEDNNGFVDFAFENKLLLAAAGNDAVRILPPLNISQEDVLQIITKLEAVLVQWHQQSEVVA